MNPNVESLYWRTNPDWYTIDENTGWFKLTALATPRAIDSFNMYMKHNGEAIKKFNKEIFGVAQSN